MCYEDGKSGLGSHQTNHCFPNQLHFPLTHMNALLPGWHCQPLGSSKMVQAMKPFLSPIKWFLLPLNFYSTLYPVQLLLSFCELLSPSFKDTLLESKGHALYILPNSRCKALKSRYPVAVCRNVLNLQSELWGPWYSFLLFSFQTYQTANTLVKTIKIKLPNIW